MLFWIRLLVQFRPKDLCFVSETTEIFNEGRVCIVNIDNVTISIEDELFIEKNGKFSKVKLLDIQENGKSVQQVSNGEYGLKLSSKISKKSLIWKKGSR